MKKPSGLVPEMRGESGFSSQMYKTELRPPLWHWSLSHRYIVPIFHNAFIFVEETAIYMSLLRTHTPAGRYDDKRMLWMLTSSWFLVDRLYPWLYPIRQGDVLSHPLIQLKSSYDSFISTEAWKFIPARLRQSYCREYHGRGCGIFPTGIPSKNLVHDVISTEAFGYACLE